MSASSTAPRDLSAPPTMPGLLGFSRGQGIALILLVAFLLAGPFVLYPVFLMKLLCFALFACAFNLLIGYVGLLSFGHAAFFGMGGYLLSLIHI